MRWQRRLELLLGRGYFPSELPPPFVTQPFARKFRKFVAAWDAAKKTEQCQLEKYSFPRVGHSRRLLAIPNPIPQLHLAYLIAHEWSEIRKFVRSSSVTTFNAKFVENSERALEPINFDAIKLIKTRLAAEYGRSVETDISQFYPSLYTHAIAWALHGKAWCKQHLNKQSHTQSLGARLDKAVRYCQQNQSIGIPIGPDTSRILSEIVGVGIDLSIREHLGKVSGKAIRVVDDIYVGLPRWQSPEVVLGKILSAFAEFELRINDAKTLITSHPAADRHGWTAQLKLIPLVGSFSQATELEKFFDLLFDLARQYPDHNVPLYGAKVLRSVRFHQDGWKIAEAYLLNLCRTSPACLPTVGEIFINARADGLQLNVDSTREFLINMLKEHGDNLHHGEVAWCLFLAKGLQIALPNVAVSHLRGMDSSVIALLLHDLKSLGLVRTNLKDSFWYENLDNSLRSSLWLFAYEGVKKGWLRGKWRKMVEADKHFEHLLSNDIYFYDERRNVPTRSKRMARERRFAQLRRHRYLGFLHYEF